MKASESSMQPTFMGSDSRRIAFGTRNLRSGIYGPFEKCLCSESNASVAGQVKLRGQQGRDKGHMRTYAQKCVCVCVCAYAYVHV